MANVFNYFNNAPLFLINKKWLLASLALLFCVAQSFAQATLQGKVIDEATQNPIAGATVVVKSTTSGAVTGVDGQFSFQTEAALPLTLNVTLLGYASQEVKVSDANGQIVIVLSEGAINLDEVVVTSLNITRAKKSLGYSVQGLSSDALETRPTSALSALSGRVAGLQVISGGSNMGGSLRVILRGINSITGNNQPLYVVDGVPIDNTDLNDYNSGLSIFSNSNLINGSTGKDVGSTIQDINPDDVADISVLKGPAAAALYGSRAANGVILISTKKGAKVNGEANGKFEVQVNTGVDFEKVVRLPKRQKLYGGGLNSTFSTADINGKTYNIVEYDADESWGPKLDGTPVLHWYNLDPEYPDDYLNPQPWVYPKNDVESFFETGISNTNNIALSYANGKSAFRVSITNKNVSGTVPNSSLNRNSINISGDHKEKWVSFFGNANYLKTETLGRPWTGAGNRSVMQSAYQWAQVQVDYKKLSEYKRPDGTQRAWNRTGYQNTTADEKTRYIDNPYWAAYESYLEEDRDRLYGNVGISLTPATWLTLTGRINGDVFQYNSQDRMAIGSRTGSFYQEYNQRFHEFNYEFLATANKTWNDHSLVANVGSNYLQQQRRISNVLTAGSLIIPHYYSLQNATSVIVHPSTGIYNKALSSVYGSVSYGWKKTIYIDGTARNDWSSTLPTKNNSYMYPSVTSSLILTELPVLNEQSWLSFAKVRLGWAQVGNDTDPYQLYKTYEAVNAINGNTAYVLPGHVNNNDLKPEITSSIETGLQLQFFNNLVGLDVTYYDNTSRNQILSLPVSNAFGYNSQIINAGEINNKGLEIILNANPIRTKDFEWTATANFSKNTNEIIKLSDAASTLDLSTSLITLIAEEGKSYGQLRGYDFVYTPDGQKVVGEDGVYMRTQQLESLGSILPDFLWGFRNQFRYKNFSLGFLIDSRVGGKFFSQTYKVGMYAGILESTAANNIRETGVITDGVKADVDFHSDGTYTVSNVRENDTRVTAQEWSRNQYSGPTAHDIFDGTFIKLREITLGYEFNLPQGSLVRQISALVYARDLFYLYRASKIIDPEFANSSGNIQGAEGASFPTPLTFGFNIGLKF